MCACIRVCTSFDASYSTEEVLQAQSRCGHVCVHAYVCAPPLMLAKAQRKFSRPGAGVDMCVCACIRVCTSYDASYSTEEVLQARSRCGHVCVCVCVCVCVHAYMCAPPLMQATAQRKCSRPGTGVNMCVCVHAYVCAPPLMLAKAQRKFSRPGAGVDMCVCVRMHTCVHLF